MKVIYEMGSKPIRAWVGSREHVDAPDIEDSALSQLKNLARLPFLAKHGVAVMPDVHAGIGSTVGTVIATDRAIIPAAVGVDIGCGMNAVRLSLKASQLPDSLLEIRNQIERDIPLGPGGARMRDDYLQDAYKRLGFLADQDALYGQHTTIVDPLFKGDSEKFYKKAASQLGTLGSGNHFIELCTDENQDVWVMLHSGSRGIGNQIGSHYIGVAKRLMEQFFISLTDQDLAYLPEASRECSDYMEAVGWAQDYALMNRRLMMEYVLKALARRIPVEFTTTSEAINCHHNYVEKENHFGQNLWVTRKGAIRARTDDLGIIPGSMGQRSYIVRGKGNPDAYCSCSHGAGRRMSRTMARKHFSITDLIAQTEGVECRKDKEVLDEIPGAYKDMDTVMENQRDLVEVVHTLKAVLCVKGA